MGAWLRSLPAVRPLVRPVGALLLLAAVIMLLARSHQRNADYHDEVHIWEANVRDRPGSWVARNNLACYYYTRGDVLAAEQQLREALALDPSCLRTLENLGFFFSNRVLPDQAEAFLRRAIERKSRNSDVYRYLAEILSGQGRNEDALTVVETALRMRPARGVLYRERGMILYRMGKPGEAAGDLKRATALAPDDAGAHLYLALLAYEAGYLDAAREHLRRATPVEWDPIEKRGVLADLKPHADGFRQLLDPER